jgi:hypothetical protein
MVVPMKRWIVAALLLSACHQPVPVRPARAPTSGSPDAALTTSNPSTPDSDAGPAVAVQDAAAAPLATPSFPPDAAVITSVSTQRSLVVQKTGLELWSNDPPQKITTLLGVEARDISFSPAGDVAVAAVCTNAGTMDCTFNFFRAADGSVMRTLLVPILDNAQFSETGRYFLYSNQHGLYVVQMATGVVAAHRENGDATSVSAFGGLEDGIEGNASAGWPGIVRVLDDRLVRSSQGLVEVTDLVSRKVLTKQLYKGAGPFAHLLLDDKDTVLTFDAAAKALFVWRYPSLGVAAPRRPVPPKKILLRNVITDVCNDCQLAKAKSGDSIVLESSDEDFSIEINLATGATKRTDGIQQTK